MKPTSKSLPALADIERAVVAESREWGRQRLQERLQQLADQSGEVFPPEAAAAPTVNAPQRTGRNRARR